MNCPPFGIECIGGAELNVSNGYWRESLTSILLEECDSSISSCVGGIGAN
jgi:hypothetical protein